MPRKQTGTESKGSVQSPHGTVKESLAWVENSSKNYITVALKYPDYLCVYKIHRYEGKIVAHIHIGMKELKEFILRGN